MPGRRNHRGFGVTIVDHPAPLEVERRIDLAALGAVIAVAELILADELAIERGPHLRAEGLAIPPGEEAREEGRDFHRRSLRTACSCGRSCQLSLILSSSALSACWVAIPVRRTDGVIARGESRA